MKFVKNLLVLIFIILASIIKAQNKAVDVDNTGLVTQYRSSIFQQNSGLFQGGTAFFTGGFYNFVRNPQFSIPMGLSCSFDHLRFNDHSFSRKYLNLDLACRIFLLPPANNRFYVEMGIQGRLLLNHQTLTLFPEQTLSLNNYQAEPKLSVGAQFSSNSDFVVYINAFYCRSLNNLLKQSDIQLFNQYAGISASIVLGFRCRQKTNWSSSKP